ncbi:hypothetical protein [Streptomyces barringtoniae]|uniref:hypothetical protein n=1 Tax=Streptomyces barringtoniae TaxID=2892029 RepID=UPI003FD878DC
MASHASSRALVLLGMPVPGEPSGRAWAAGFRPAMGMVQLVVSELVTNARKYAPGPCLLTLEIEEGTVAVSVWDSSTMLRSVLAADPDRIGQHLASHQVL